MSLYCKISFEIDQLSIILIVIGFCCYGNIYFKYDTVWMNCNIQQTVSVLKLVSNALFRLQKQQAGFAGGSQSTSERAAQAVVARDTSRQEKTVWAPPGGAQWAKSGGEAVLLQFMWHCCTRTISVCAAQYCQMSSKPRTQLCSRLYNFHQVFHIHVLWHWQEKSLNYSEVYNNYEKNAAARWHCNQNIWCNLLWKR